MLCLSNTHFSTTGKRFCICDSDVFVIVKYLLWLWSICDSGAFVIVKYLRFWCICDCDTKAKLAPADSATAEEKAIYSKASAHAQCSCSCTCMIVCVHERCHVYMCTCAYAYAYMCIHERCHVNTKACVNGIWGWWWNSILAIWLPSVVYLYNQENIYFIACRCIMYILISENWNGMGYLWIYDWYVFPVKEQIHGSAK